MSCIRLAIRHRWVWYLVSTWLRCCSRLRCLDGLIRGILLGCNYCVVVLRFVVDASVVEFIGLAPYVTKKTKINILYYIIYIYTCVYMCMYI